MLKTEMFYSTLFWLGICYCIFYLLFPFLYSALKTPFGKIWVPINNQHFHPGDNRIYGSCVQEARLNFFKHKHPCSSEIGNMAIDFTRITSYRTAAFLGLFIPDERFAFIISFTLSLLIQYILIFHISMFLFNAEWISLLISILVIFWFKILVYLNSWRPFKSSYEYIKNNIVNYNGDLFFDVVNDNFRYVIMSVAGIYVWITIILIQYLQSDPQIIFSFCIFIIVYLFFRWMISTHNFPYSNM